MSFHALFINHKQIYRNGDVKLCDFGFSRKLKSRDDQDIQFCGTPLYLAPEIWERKPHGLKADIWAIGSLICELCRAPKPLDGIFPKIFIVLVILYVFL